MFVDELRMAVAAEENAEIVEPRYVALKFHSIDQKNRDGGFAFAHGIQERVLQILLFVGHDEPFFFGWLPPLDKARLSIVGIVMRVKEPIPPQRRSQEAMRAPPPIPRRGDRVPGG